MKRVLIKLVSLPAAIFYSATAMVIAGRKGAGAWEFLSALVCYAAIALWLVADARRRGRRVAYDFDSVMFFFWPVGGPIYLFGVHGWRAVLPLAAFAALLGAACVISLALTR